MGNNNLTIIHLSLISIAAIIPALFLMDWYTLYVIIGSLLVTTSAAVAYSYWPSAKIALHVKASELKPVDILSISFVLLFFFTAAREAYITIWRQSFSTGFHEDIGRWVPPILFRYWLLVSAILVLKALPSVADGNHIQRMFGWPRITIALGSGAILSTVLLLI